MLQNDLEVAGWEVKEKRDGVGAKHRTDDLHGASCFPHEIASRCEERLMQCDARTHAKSCCL